MGLLLATLVFWLLASFGFLDNSAGGIVLAWLLVFIFALAVFQRHAEGDELASWWRENRKLVIVAELVFLILFCGWALFRAHQNTIVGTEKPMELAFFSAVQRSSGFPPDDPWMSGYAISYYYMGYVMWSALATLSGVASTVGFNLTVASLFALTGLTAFGVACNLARSRNRDSLAPGDQGASFRAAAGVGLLAMALTTLVGNFQLIIVEAPYQTRAASETYLDYWGTQERSRFAEGVYAQDPNGRTVAAIVRLGLLVVVPRQPRHNRL